jgi:hypothetical protein
MGLPDEVRDPWGLLVSAVSGGLAWAVGLDPAAALGIAGAVLAVKVASGTLFGRERAPAGDLPVRQGSPEDAWLRRAEKAARSLRDVAHSAEAGPIADRLRSVVTETGSTISDLRRLAGQTSSVTAAMHRVDLPALQREEAQLQEVLASANVAVHPETERSLASVRSQLDVHRRLYDTASAMLARMQSGALGLESLVARIAELVALGDASPGLGDGLAQLDELASDLEGLRVGLHEAEELSRQALGGYAGARGGVFRKDGTRSRDRGRAGPLEGGS